MYWPGRGLMEPARMMCAISGTEFSDERLSAPPADNEILKSNMGRMPLLVTPEGVAIGQSAAIYHYVAQTQGFLGANPAEAAQILSIVEHLKELNLAWGKLVPSSTTPTEEALTAFFDDATAADVIGVADRAAASKRALKWFLGRMEEVVGAKGFAVGTKLSLADVMLFYVLGDVVPPTPATQDSLRREPFTSAARTAGVLAAYPKVAAIVAEVKANANLQKYLATRPSTSF